MQRQRVAAVNTTVENELREVAHHILQQHEEDPEDWPSPDLLERFQKLLPESTYRTVVETSAPKRLLRMEHKGVEFIEVISELMAICDMIANDPDSADQPTNTPHVA